MTTIRPERAGEEAAVRAINDAAFGNTKNGGIVDGIRGTDRWIDGASLVAGEPNGALVGHLLVSEGDLDIEDGTIRRIWMIGPVGVVPDRQRQGIGGALMRGAIDLAIERSQPVLCLLGHADYYPRFGFRPARAIGIDPPRPWRDANWLALPLPAWDASWRGVARFPGAFPDSQ
jgi:predicted N-acetyltransferase YhbS